MACGPVRPGAGRVGRRGGRVPQHPGHVARGGAVVGQHARVATDRLQRLDHRCMSGTAVVTSPHAPVAAMSAATCCGHTNRAVDVS